eukprot:6875026-Alexandrium_andersonii.AAC.1
MFPGNGIVAGESQSNSMATAILFDLLSIVSSRRPSLTLKQYVDDLALRGVGGSRVWWRRWVVPGWTCTVG